MGFSGWIILAFAWLALVGLAVAARRLSTDPNDLRTGLARLGMLLYAKALHRLRVEGEIRDVMKDSPVLIVANHTAGVDPLLIQAAIPRFIRWIMASDMRWPELDPLWRFGRIIFIDRHEGGSAGLREALRALRDGDVVGIFPEGGIERPRRTILPFRDGVGMMIRRSKAIVVPIVIEGTPSAPTAKASLWTPSRARLRVMPPIDYRDSGLSAAEIAVDLRARFLEWTGWPESDQPPMPG